MNIPKMTDADIQNALTTLPDWALQNCALTKTYQFADFAGSLQFVNAVGERAEAANHHPDIDIRYSKVTLALITHDSGGITQKDVKLAKAADALAAA